LTEARSTGHDTMWEIGSYIFGILVPF
jgi:hypothetical protein